MFFYEHRINLYILTCFIYACMLVQSPVRESSKLYVRWRWRAGYRTCPWTHTSTSSTGTCLVEWLMASSTDWLNDWLTGRQKINIAVRRKKTRRTFISPHDYCSLTGNLRTQSLFLSTCQKKAELSKLHRAEI